MSIQYRVKKKRRNPRDCRVTLDAQHKLKIEELEKLEKNLPTMRKELNKIIKEKETLARSDSGFGLIESTTGKKIYYLNQQVRRLRKKIKDIETGKMRDEYYAKTAHILYSYYDNIKCVAQRHLQDDELDENNLDDEQMEQYVNAYEGIAPKKKVVPKRTVIDFFNKANSRAKDKNVKKTYSSTKISDFVDMTERSNRANLLEAYTKVVNPKSYRPAHNYVKTEIDICPRCEMEMSLIQSEGLIVCPQCGREEPIIIDSEKPSYKDPPPEAGEFTYKRINRFDEWLTQYQAKETTEIPQDVLDKILIEMNKEGITNLCRLTMEKVRGYLKKLGLNKYYEHIPHIIYCLNGLPTPRLTQATEEKLRSMFRQIQDIFDQVCPNNRTNFLSYSYLLRKL
ncbi:MAG: hypothetical protein ACXADH_15330, partial [Candidatus Kariarchaeaceae archaeon]